MKKELATLPPIDRILDAAEAEFADRPFKAVSIREIAEQAGVLHPNFYKYFKTKEDLYSAVLRRALQPLRDLVAGFKDMQHTADASDPLRNDVFDLMTAHPKLPFLIFRALASSDEDVGREQVLRWMQMAIEQGRRVVVRPASPSLEESQDVLITVATILLGNGFFWAAPIFARSLNITLSEAGLQIAWKHLMNTVFHALVENPPPSVKPRKKSKFIKR